MFPCSGCPLACVQKLLITPVLFPFGAFAREIDTKSALHRLRNTVRLARVDGLASLLDFLQNGCVVQVLLGCDGCGLALEGDVEVLDAWEEDVLASSSCTAWMGLRSNCLVGC
jgi:hypothetical protein